MRHVSDQAALIEQTVRTAVRAEISELRAFVDRRIAELSAELHAAVELMDFSENNLSAQLGGIREQITSMIAMPARATRTSGLELEAVVQATEDAANRIMEAAEAIGARLADARRDPNRLDEVEKNVSVIFEACMFQDLTGQRIRRAIQHLQQVESMLTGITPPMAPVPEVRSAAGTGPDLEQDAVDALFAPVQPG
jgi:chemotaxis protein CheZ